MSMTGNYEGSREWLIEQNEALKARVAELEARLLQSEASLAAVNSAYVQAVHRYEATIAQNGLDMRHLPPPQQVAAEMEQEREMRLRSWPSDMLRATAVKNEWYRAPIRGEGDE